MRLLGVNFFVGSHQIRPLLRGSLKIKEFQPEIIVRMTGKNIRMKKQTKSEWQTQHIVFMLCVSYETRN
jgi:hypothetical protein